MGIQAGHVLQVVEVTSTDRNAGTEARRALQDIVKVHDGKEWEARSSSLRHANNLGKQSGYTFTATYEFSSGNAQAFKEAAQEFGSTLPKTPVVRLTVKPGPTPTVLPPFLVP